MPESKLGGVGTDITGRAPSPPFSGTTPPSSDGFGNLQSSKRTIEHAAVTTSASSVSSGYCRCCSCFCFSAVYLNLLKAVSDPCYGPRGSARSAAVNAVLGRLVAAFAAGRRLCLVRTTAPDVALVGPRGGGYSDRATAATTGSEIGSYAVIARPPPPPIDGARLRILQAVF
jgi:hypothetical protein